MAEFVTALLPPEVSLTVALVLIGLSAATSFITAAFDIGGGVLLIGVLASLLPPTALIPVHGFVQLGSNTGRATLLRKHIEWGLIPAFLGGTAIGAVLGGLIAVNLPGAVVQVGVGAFILVSIYIGLPEFGRAAGWIVGTISSFLSMFFGSTGPFVATHIRSLGLDRLGHVSTHAAMMTVQHVLKILTFGVFGFAFGPYLALIFAMIATGLVGTAIGRLVLLRANETWFGRVLNAILTILALRLIISGLGSVLWPDVPG